MSYDQILAKVSQVLVCVLNVDEDEITPTSNLQSDLGAESIDFLDIVFRLEREFCIKIPRNELFPEAVFWNESEYVDGRRGTFTPKGIAELKAKMPFADIFAFESDFQLSNFSDLFTVKMVCKYVEWRLERH